MEAVDEDRRWRHPAGAVPAVLGLLAVVALAVGRHSWSESSSGSRHLPSGFWDSIASGVLVLWLVASAFSFREYLRIRRRHGGPIRPVSWKRAAMIFGTV